jgi:hypothetical protein
MDEMSKSGNDSQILFANNLQYTLPTPSSVASNRVMKKNYFQQRNYLGSTTAIAQLNTGTDFIDPINSTLNITIKPNWNTLAAKGLASFGVGSVQNIIKNIRIYHRSGTTYTNTIKQNLFACKRDRYNKSYNWFGSIGTPLMGYNNTSGADTPIFAFDPDGQNQLSVEFCIPLNLLHGFFNPLGEPLIPAAVASGLRVEIDLEDAKGAFFNTLPTNYITSYEVVDIYFNLMSVSLMDSAQASINAVAAKSSLEYLYLDLFTSTNSQPSANTAVNIDVNKSVALLNEAITVIQTQKQVSDYFSDMFSTSYYPGNWWFQLGSNQYPQQKVNTTLTAYQQALQTFDKMKHDDLLPNTDLYSFTTRDGIYSQSFERNTALALSQQPVNASRSLRFEFTYTDTPVASLVVVFLEYLTSSRTTLLNSRIDI